MEKISLCAEIAICGWRAEMGNSGLCAEVRKVEMEKIS